MGLASNVASPRGCSWVGSIQKTRSNPPKKPKKNGLGWVIRWVWFIKMENP